MPYSYAIDSLAYNPAFQAAWNTPNFNQMALAQSVPTTAGTTTDSTNVVNKPKEKEEKSSSAAKYVLGAVAVAGAALLCKKAYSLGKPGSGFWNQLGSGFKEMGASITNWGKGVKNKIANPEVFSVTKVGEETVCTIPGQKNIIKSNIGEQAQKLGISTDVARLAEKESKILSYTIEEGGKTITVRGGNVVGYKNGDTPLNIKQLTAPTAPEDVNISEKIKDIIAKVGQRDAETLEKIKDVYFTQTVDGTTRRFVANAADPNKNGLRGIITNRFGIDSPTVKQYRLHNEQVEKALKGFTDGKLDNLKIAEAQYNVTDIGKFKIKNDQIEGITVGENYYAKGSKEFDALLYDNKTTFENVLKNKDSFTDIVYHLA